MLVSSIIAVMAAIIIILSLKIAAVRKSAREIEEGFRSRLEEDTNTLIDISCRDKAMRGLAGSINSQLKLLRSERQRFQQGDLELKEAITNISHDLRTPLTAICGYLELMSQTENPDDLRRYLKQIENRTEVLKQLTEELFRYSVITSTHEEEMVRVDLGRALEESLVSFYGAMQGRGITPDIEITDTPVIRILDPTALSRIFSNIISNALKYSGGDFAVTMKDTGEISFSNLAPDLDPIMAGRLFDRFFTVETGRNSTGLGLSIARLLTERMGGSISAGYSGGRLTITVTF